jgi:hypothetical protein
MSYILLFILIPSIIFLLTWTGYLIQKRQLINHWRRRISVDSVVWYKHKKMVSCKVISRDNNNITINHENNIIYTTIHECYPSPQR